MSQIAVIELLDGPVGSPKNWAIGQIINGALPAKHLKRDQWEIIPGPRAFAPGLRLILSEVDLDNFFKRVAEFFNRGPLWRHRAWQALKAELAVQL